MATVINKTVGSAGGRDYATLHAAFAAVNARSSLVANDEQWNLYLYNDSEFSYVANGTADSLSVTADSTRFVTIQPAAGQGFADNVNAASNALRYNQGNGVGYRFPAFNQVAPCLVINAAYTQINGMQIYQDDVGFAAGTFGIQLTAGNVTFNGCILQARSSNTAYVAQMIQGNGSSSNAKFINTVMIDQRSLAASSTNQLIANNGTPWSFYNCDIVRSTDAGGGVNGRVFSSDKGSFFVVNMKNTRIFGFASLSPNSNTETTNSYNSTDFASLNGTNTLTSQTFANEYVNPINAGDYRTAATSSGKTAGIRDQTNTLDLDIVKQSRRTGTGASAPSIGAFEYGAVGNYTSSMSEAITLVDSNSNSGTFGSSQEEVLNALDQTYQGNLFNSSMLEALSLTETITTTVIMTSATSEVITATASSTGTTAGAGTVTFQLVNNTGTPLTSLSGVIVHILDKTTWSRLAAVTGLTSDISGNLTVTNAAMSIGSSYGFVIDIGGPIPGFDIKTAS